MSTPTISPTQQEKEKVQQYQQNNLKPLFEAALRAKERAYCPYSHFRVGAALLTSSPTGSGTGTGEPEGGIIITGANVENASFPVGVCAERCAFGTAVSSGYRTFVALAVASDVTPPASPCGMCRQFIREFCPLTMPVYMLDVNGEHVVKTLGELLPMSFGPGDLKEG